MGSPELAEDAGCRLSIEPPVVVRAAEVAGVSNHAPPRVALLGKPAVAHISVVKPGTGGSGGRREMGQEGAMRARISSCPW